MAAKRVSVRLEDFPAEELEHLVLWYPFIRRELERRPRITIPRVTSASEALRVLYELEARGDLWIRISTSGNLNVDVRMREYELDDAGHVYSPVVKVPSLERLAQRLREHPGEDPLLARGAWRFSIAPETLEPPSRWQAEAESREYATFIEPPGDIARVRLSTVASLLVRELPQLDESKAARIALLIDQKLKALVEEANWPTWPGIVDEEFDGRASYHVARTVLNEVPDVERELAKRIGQAVLNRWPELLSDEAFPESL